MTERIRIGVVGVGKIAETEHLPAIERSADFDLAFIADRHLNGRGDLPVFKTLEAALASGINFDAVALCTSPQPRFDLCRMLFTRPCAVLLEKPPAASPIEARTLRAEAERNGVNLFAAWHSRFAPKIAEAQDWARQHELRRGTIEWRENPAKWHPGQAWLYQAGGLGVFDPGINALSILTALYEGDWVVRDPHFRIPENAHTPISSDFKLTAGGAEIDASFEFHQSENEVWSIKLEARDGDTLELFDGGAGISVNRAEKSREMSSEYDRVYSHFASLIKHGKSDMDIRPLEIVSDAFLLARKTIVAPQNV